MFLPEWAPNVHPMLVHFPIALWCAAVAFDVVALVWSRQGGLRIAASLLYAAGALGALAAFLTGRASGDVMLLSGAANTVLTDHADWATITVWSLGAFAALRLILWRFSPWGANRALRVGLCMIGAGGLFLVFETASHGARMVFEHGVGVQRVAGLEEVVAEQRRALEQIRGQSEGPRVESDGSWSWTPGTYALREAFVFRAGQLDAQTDAGPVVKLTTDGSAAFFVMESSLESVQLDVALGAAEFYGSLQIVHHVQDTLNYLFTELSGGVMRQGRMERGQAVIMDEKPFTPLAWTQLRVVADETHFRAYADGVLVTHAHGQAPEAGPVGIRLEGAGSVLLGRMEAQSLR